MKWYKHDPNAALEGMRGLTAEERGAYYTLIDAYYARDGHIQDDDWLLSRILECNPRTWRRLKIALFLKQKVIVNSAGELVPNRGEYTLNEARMFSERQAKRARSRWERSEKSNENKESSMPLAAMPIQPQPQPQPESNLKKVTLSARSQKKRERGSKINGHAIAEPEGFAEFWTLYPRKSAKDDAIKAFTKAIKRTTVEIILSAIRRQRGNWTDPQFIPYPASWLNKGQWADEPSKNSRIEGII